MGRGQGRSTPRFSLLIDTAPGSVDRWKMQLGTSRIQLLG